jgi:two-component system response regulator NreC
MTAAAVLVPCLTVAGLGRLPIPGVEVMMNRAAPKLTVVLIDDHDLFCEVFGQFLHATGDVHVAGWASDARSGIALVERVCPRVVVLDVSLPGTDGFSTLAELRRRKVDAPVLMLTGQDLLSHAARALSLGAKGFALKKQPADQILTAVRQVAAGDTYLPPNIPREVCERIGHVRAAPGGAAVAAGERPSVLDMLSPREQEIFLLIARGCASARIARDLCISVKTVETHRRHIHEKLGVHSALELVHLAAQSHLILD